MDRQDWQGKFINGPFFFKNSLIFNVILSEIVLYSDSNEFFLMRMYKNFEQR